MAAHNATQNEKATNTNVENEKGTASYVPDGRERPEAVPDQNAQDGVRIAEAMTLSWSKTSLIVVYIWYRFVSLREAALNGPC